MDLTKLKQMRTDKGMTQVEVSVKLGVSLMAYRLWEMGAGKPNRENYENLLELFKTLPFTDE